MTAAIDTPSDRTLGRASLWVAAGTALSRLTGFARVFALAYAIGQSPLADLYTKANFAPNLIFELVVGGVLSATLVPLFVDAREKRDDEATSVLLSVGFVASATLSLVALAITFIVDLGWTAHLEGLAGDQTEALTRFHIVTGLLYLMLPQILFYGISSLSTAYLNANRRYRTAAFAPVLTNLFTIVAFIVIGVQLQGESAILAATDRNLSALIWLGLGTTGGIVAMTIPMMLEVRRSEADISFLPRFRHRTIRRMTRLSTWTFGYVIANQLAMLSVIVFLGDNKRYADAFVFFQLPHGLVAVSIMTTMTPELASAAARHDYQALADRFVKGLRLLAVLIIPAAVGYVILATPITSFLARGNFSQEDARLTGHVVAAFAVGLPAFSTYLFACRGFYALSDTKTPFLLNVLENGINIVGIVGLVAISADSSTSFAAAYSVAYIVAAAAALWRFDQRLHQLDPTVQRPDLMPIAKMAAASAAMGLAVLLVRLIAPGDSGLDAVLSVVAGVIVGGLVYGGAGLLLRVDEIERFVGRLRRSVGV